MGSLQAAGSLVARARNYQVELFEQARERNVLAFLDTGAGKTLISILLIRDKANQLLCSGGTKKFTVFFVPKVALVFQQAEALRQNTDLAVRALCGEMNVDFWNKVEWDKQVDNHDVLVLTPQILLDKLRQGFVKMQDINLLILDECHHAMKKHPYNRIMQEFYYTAPLAHRPHVFGMTASPVNTKAVDIARLSRAIAELESNLDAKVMTVADRDEVERFAPLPVTDVLTYPPVKPTPVVEAALEKLHSVAAELRAFAAGIKLERERARVKMYEADLPEGIVFDEQNLSCESKSVAAHIASSAYILGQMGPWCAAACLAQMLAPRAHNMYAALSALHAKQGDAAASNPALSFEDDGEGPDWCAPLSSDNMLLVSTRVWSFNFSEPRLTPNLVHLHHVVGGHQLRTSSEQVTVDSCLEKAVIILADLITASKPARLAVVEALTSDTNEGKRKRLRAAMEAALASVPPAELDADVGSSAHGGWGGGARGCSLITPKVAILIEELKAYKDAIQAFEGTPTHWSCIVFVQRKMAALALHALIAATPHLAFLSSAPFMGYGGNIAATCLDVKSQTRTLKRFRAGEVNTLISTSVAEEGLDLKQCQLVVRFDLPPTLLAFIQSRGRARVAASRMLLMLEQHNAEHDAFAQNAPRYEEMMREEAQRRREEDASNDSGSDDIENDLQYLAVPDDEREFHVSSSGAKVTMDSAKDLLFYFCAKLPGDRYTQLRPRFSTEPGFVSRVFLPNNCAVRVVTGRQQPSSSLARASACLEACRQLYQAGALTEYLLPNMQTELEEEPAKIAAAAAAAAAEDSDTIPEPAKLTVKTVELRQVVPKVLKGSIQADRGCLHQLHLYSIELERPEATPSNMGSVVEQPFGWLLLRPLPHGLPSFELGQPATTKTHVTLVHRGIQEMTDAQLKQLQTFHNTVLVEKAGAFVRDLANLDSNAASAASDRWFGIPKGAWFCFAPLVAGTQPFQIDWRTVQAAQQGLKELPNLPPERQAAASLLMDTLKDRVVVTRYNGFCYTFRQVRSDLTLDSEFPKSAAPVWEVKKAAKQAKRAKEQAAAADRGELDATDVDVDEPVVAPPKQAAKDEKTLTFREYYQKRWNITLVEEGRPLLEVYSMRTMITQIRGTDPAADLDPDFAAPEDGPDTVYLVPEACCLHELPAPAFITSRILPRLLWWLNSLLMVAQLRPQLLPQSLGPNASVPTLMSLLEATTSRSCMEAFSLERLETMGDGFLKFAVSLHLFLQFPAAHEGQLERRKSALISNVSLAVVGMRMGLPGYITHPFERCRYSKAWGHSDADSGGQKAEKGTADGGCTTASAKRKASAATTNENTMQPIEQPSAIAPGACPRSSEQPMEATCAVAHPPSCSEECNHAQEVDCQHPQVASESADAMEVDGADAAKDLLPKEDGVFVTKTKMIADCFEALVGAFFMAGGEALTTPYLRHIGILPKDKAEFKYPEPSASSKGPASRLERALGYEFRHRELLLEALTHCSWIDSGRPCYQRLEFLGDAVMDILITRHYFLTYRYLPPGGLHDLRSASVNNNRLAAIAVVHRLPCNLWHCSPPLHAHINAFVDSIASATPRMNQQQAAAQGQGQDQPKQPAAAGSSSESTRAAQYAWATTAHFGAIEHAAPKVLGDILESVVGAIFLDTGMDLDATWAVLEPLMQPMVTPDTVPIHPIRDLNERAQKAGLSLKYISTLAQQDGRVTTVAQVGGKELGVATGCLNSREGRKLASEDALKHWHLRPAKPDAGKEDGDEPG